jgi:hypothetical protein
LTTQELYHLSEHDAIDPCILFDVQPKLRHIIPYRTTTITLVQVTPATSCRDARDGAVTSVELLNDQNEGQGIAIGFHQDYYVQFRLVSLIAGNADTFGTSGETMMTYGDVHSAVLRAALQSLQPQYIVGTCSFAAAYEKDPALDYQTIVMAQVGPPGYYEDSRSKKNPYVFGAHINSDDYPIHTIRSLGFWAAQPTTPSPAEIPVKVIYRTGSEFFYSTCRSAIRALQEFGFTDLQEILYTHNEDHDNDGELNQFDPDFVRDLADQACPPNNNNAQDDDDFQNPALFACVLTEQDMLLARWKENGCRPVSLWLTAATWGWAADNPDMVPFMQGGGQWHEAFTYSDRFFDSGVDVLKYNEEKFGYYGSYDTVVAYAIPVLFAQHIESAYRVIDDPDPMTDFSNPEGYERLRRDLIVLNVDTIFGPVAFNTAQRNIGRAAAGTQWQPVTVDDTDGSNVTTQKTLYNNVLVSPFFQAEAEVVIPAASAVNCEPGSYIQETLITNGSAILDNKCAPCPIDTFTAQPNQWLSCQPCPYGSSTVEQTGQHYCVAENDNLLSTATLVFGYTAVAITWLCSASLLYWLITNRKDPVVRISQYEFMILVCVGACISSSTIIALSWQAAHDEDTDAASRACQAAPFLYTIGWVLQYASLSAKSFRLHKIMNHPSMQRVTVTVWETANFIVRILVLDLLVVIVWTIVHPLEYVRTTTSVEFDDTTNIMTINSIGRCEISADDEEDEPVSIWVFVGPIIAVHALLMITTNVILYKVRNVGDRYQEQKYVALASIFACEVLVIGLPVVLAVGDNPGAVFIVFAGIIALNDIGILGFVFVPKIIFQRKGLAEGVAVGETILKDTHRKAVKRESTRRSVSRISVSGLEYSRVSVSRLADDGQCSEPFDDNNNNNQSTFSRRLSSRNSFGDSQFSSDGQNSSLSFHPLRVSEGTIVEEQEDEESALVDPDNSRPHTIERQATHETEELTPDNTAGDESNYEAIGVGCDERERLLLKQENDRLKLRIQQIQERESLLKYELELIKQELSS